MLGFKGPALKPRDRCKLLVGIVARISGCANQKELSIEDQIDHVKQIVAELYEGPVRYMTIATTGKGEALDRPELGQIKAALLSKELDLLIMEDLGRLVRGAEAVRLLGVAVDHGTRVISPNDCLDTAEGCWEADALSACHDHVAHNAHTSKRLKHKLFNCFLRYGGATARPIAGYIVPPGTKTYGEWQKDDATTPVIAEGLRQLKATTNYSAVADFFNSVPYNGGTGFPTGPYCRRRLKDNTIRKTTRWDGKMVRRFYHNRVLGGAPGRGFRHTIKVHEIGGSRQVIHTDDAWRLWFGPLLEADLIMGECYDARLEAPGWDRPGFDDRRWLEPRVFADSGTELVAPCGPAMRHVQELRPVAAPKQVGRNWVFDLGQNMVGVARLRVRAPAGTTVQLRFGEMLNPDGSLYTANLRTARATDYYTCRGDGDEEWTPRFTFHGFRYVELSGLPGTPTADAVTGIVIHSAMLPAGEFECSAPLVNQLQHNIRWGRKGNFLDVPTDCPQRDERLGWMGDAQVFIRTAAFNMDVLGFFAKWFRDIRDAQDPAGRVPCIVPITHPGLAGTDGGPAWADATVICPWVIYECYGDRRILEDHYDCMVRYVEYLRSTSRDGIRCWDGCEYPQGFGDWLALDGSGDSKGGTPFDLIGTAFYARSAWLLSRAASVLGRDGDAATYQGVFEQARAAFQRRYVTDAGLIASRTQTSYLLALRFELLPESLRPAAAAELVNDIARRGMHLATGFIGTPHIAPALSAVGRSDIAYALLNQTTCPSWLYAVTLGATTIWERWDGWTPEKGYHTPGMNSSNHYAFGAVGEWLYESVAGLAPDPLQPGYKHMVIRPQPAGGLTHARASHQTPYGRAESGWRLEGGELRLDVTIPANATATIYVPCEALGQVRESGVPVGAAEGIVSADYVAGVAVLTAGAGHYLLSAQWNGVAMQTR